MSQAHYVTGNTSYVIQDEDEEKALTCFIFAPCHVFQVPAGLLLSHPLRLCNNQRVQKQLRECLVHTGGCLLKMIIQHSCYVYFPHHRVNATVLLRSTGNCDHRGVWCGVHCEDMGCRLLLSVQRMEWEAEICQKAFLYHRWENTASCHLLTSMNTTQTW